MVEPPQRAALAAAAILVNPRTARAEQLASKALADGWPAQLGTHEPKVFHAVAEGQIAVCMKGELEHKAALELGPSHSHV